ncbi:MD-2-related lipid recognition domain-containing protein / ML domain-containing protein [Perilla frutescens var. hirtella]|uniref:MD-2-related lipid recognition domain-containing protein / ML domain-containing protein n=1 Tax=Perilla frutescens var. hirtella TaxID=608512 RepID=A0AAD4P849_PERFH|nr:MD-2-related lipid recognition domain-containing protein / ML domain-containing protein [Perilla frutescens var. hirtella]KAH6829465.1 MD-2-related lipid recognition domain-containing protein / ML domain-containing protein [Perilla frutescens var. hirtella]
MATVHMKVFCGLLFALCLAVPLISATETAVKYCNNKANYIVKVNGLDIDPYPISKNKNTTFTISATTAEPITGGKLVIDVTYFWFHVHSEDHDLCKKTSCPVAVGDFLVSHSQELPGITPPGSYTLKMTMVDGNKKELTCINFDFSIGFIAEEKLSADM